MTQKRVGIYAGSFNPVHVGHIAFALQAVQAAKLDGLYFLPERQPRNKPGTEHFGHRVGMLERALRPHPKLAVLELPDVNFSVKRTLPRLKLLHQHDQLVFLFGSDVVPYIAEWPLAGQLIKNSEIVIGLRAQSDQTRMQNIVESWLVQPQEAYLLQSFAPTISSSAIRDALLHKQPAAGLLTSVVRYSDRNWLYVSVA